MKWVLSELVGFFKKVGHCFAPPPTLDSPPLLDMEEEGVRKENEEGNVVNG